MARSGYKPGRLERHWLAQHRNWWLSWRWWLVGFTALVWLPLVVDFLYELWMLLLATGRGFGGLPAEFFRSNPETFHCLGRLNSSLVYYGPVVRRVAAILAACSLAAAYDLPSWSLPNWHRLRGTIRKGIYAWMLVLMLWPAVFSISVYFTGATFAATGYDEALYPAILVLADWINICEFQQYLALAHPRFSTSRRTATAVLFALALMLANLYLPMTTHRGVAVFGVWYSPTLNVLLITTSLVMAALWWWLTVKPPRQARRSVVNRWPDSRPAPQPTPAWLPVWMHGRIVRTIAWTGLTLLVAGNVWLVILRSGVLTNPDRWPEPNHLIPAISTRHHFIRGRLTPGHDLYDYELQGELPGLNTNDPQPTDLVVVIHGLFNTGRDARYKFDLAASSLEANGYTGALSGFSWDADTHHDPLSTTGFHTGNAHAAANGRKLARFLVDYHLASPGTKLHVVGYSMGARTALECLVGLEEDPALQTDSPLLESLHLLGAAIDNEAVQVNERFGPSIANQVVAVYNYYSARDTTLGIFFPIKGADDALGLQGIESPKLRTLNYNEVNASAELMMFDAEDQPLPERAGENHLGYLGNKDKTGNLLDDGVFDLVVERIAGHNTGDET